MIIRVVRYLWHLIKRGIKIMNITLVTQILVSLPRNVMQSYGSRLSEPHPSPAQLQLMMPRSS